MACERDYAAPGAQREADFIDVVAWRSTAEFVAKWFHRGQLVAAEGRLQGRKWKDKFEQNRVSFEVIADSVYFAERAGDSPRTETSQAGAYGAPPPCYMPGRQSTPQQAAPPQQQTFGNLDVTPDDDDDVPF